MMERAESCQKLYTRLRLWEFPDEYLIEPTDGSSASSLSINRVDASIKLVDAIPECSSVRAPKIQTIFGVVGMLKLVAGSYLIVIMERECVGSYLGHPIFKVISMKILPCDHSLKDSSAEQKRVESEFSGLLKVAERTVGLFFSYDTNLTLSAQRLNDLGDESKLLPLWRQAEPRFLWNNYMLEVLIDHKLDPFLLPVVQGSFHNFQAAIGKDIIDITLIGRRCSRRNGTRMWRRGADPDGYVANFVETEQIAQMNGFVASFVQVRGSMPFLWEQIVDLTYKPKFEIVKPEEAPRVAERHFLDLRKKYGAVLAIDLVNTTGDEGRLSAKFASSVEPILNDDLRYIHFDFHKICGHVHFERLAFLYDQIADFLEKNGYLLLNDKGEKMKEQHGIVRTNCIDCLDRTNVTQSMIARKVLELQLRRIGVFAAEETIRSHPNLDEKYKILWANHGDDVSIQYSGTPALKGDFVRFGKRTVQGILNDFYNALGRYYFNNFADGTKQDAIDLLQGHYIVSVSRDITPPSQKGGLESMANFPAALGVVSLGLFLTILSLGQARYDLRHLIFAALWAAISVGVAAVVKANGRIFCNRPRLHKPRR
ncbi:SAC DOMAIN-CONTAINING PROTEIN 6, IMPAIRED IN BABA-INDUCED STERILITY 2, SUPPRESSOR OF ACTIN 1B [Hibiscus trionum]|uniref:SAC DOMAIN-CONTAINING PROTEIN 6, IMPAIRED IN BABA-INDUCED STERILITY 2, SUPPRESSOR OF ACTIN 1B n=1 Tax=Hibiscus trionum TaxID=183268 RepID=A0A9W7LL16_HIBTR|nr:SAC DOMAIN-CONTAINING PROTEIN 6, IMPAIRED IN BABA-INDUCED STERILITY 2, SUPPRESSOR OF ACTIN 1B [Hibiscus trionum]